MATSLSWRPCDALDAKQQLFAELPASRTGGPHKLAGTLASHKGP